MATSLTQMFSDVFEIEENADGENGDDPDDCLKASDDEAEAEAEAEAGS